MSTPSEKLLAVSLTSAIFWKSEGHFLRELAPLGLTKRGFRSLCRALKVPTIHIGKHHFIDVLSFVLAMRYIARVGNRDFAAPGCTSLSKGRAAHCATELNINLFRRDMEVVIAELLLASRLTSIQDRHAVQSAARVAAERMVAAAARPDHAQQLFDARAMRHLQRAASTTPLTEMRDARKKRTTAPLLPDVSPLKRAQKGTRQVPSNERHSGVPEQNILTEQT